MALTILSVASPFVPVDPDSDATEGLVAAAIDGALTRAGYRSLVIGVEGSIVSGTLLSLPRPSPAAEATGRTTVYTRLRAAVEEALERHPVDLIHLHAGDIAAALPPPGLPTLVTLHRPLDGYAPGALAVRRPDTHLHPLSAGQRSAAPSGVHLLDPIEVGVAVERLHIRIPKRNFVVGLGPVDRHSRFHLALDAARALDIQLVLSGEVPNTPEARRYFQDEIRPRLDPRRRFVGAVGFSRRRWMLGAARCLVSLRSSPEPANLPVLEALACGTPVVGFGRESLGDIIEPGLTGCLIDDVSELTDAIEASATIDPDACRQVARARHSLDVMTDRYLALYEDLVQGQTAAAGVA